MADYKQTIPDINTIKGLDLHDLYDKLIPKLTVEIDPKVIDGLCDIIEGFVTTYPLNDDGNLERFMDLIFLTYTYSHPGSISHNKYLRTINLEVAQVLESLLTPCYRGEDILVKRLGPLVKGLLNKEQYQSIHQLSVFDQILSIEADKFKLNDYENYMNQISGPTSGMILTLEEFHPFESSKDVENFFKRLEQVPIFMEEFQDVVSGQIKNGVPYDNVMIDQCLKMFRGMVSLLPEKQQMIVRMRREMEIHNLRYIEERIEHAINILKQTVYPAIQRFVDFATGLRKSESDSVTFNRDGISRCIDTEDKKSNDRGQEYYRVCLRYHTTTDLTPEQIHETGHQQVKEIKLNMAKCVNQITGSDILDPIEYLRQLEKDPKQMYPNTEEGEREALDDVNKILDKINQKVGDYFTVKPKTECEIKFTPPHQQDVMPAGYYYEPSIDSKRGGAFYMNLKSDLAKFRMATLVAHEAIPGHHYQLSLVAESKDIHPLQKIEFYNGFNAYLEGWALYTEKVGMDMELYSDPHDMLGHLMDEMLRAVRLVVDTGIHYYGWSKVKALEYMNANCPFPETNNEIEVNRYIGFPGQACSYKIGQLKIISLRDRLKEKYAGNFDVRRFNDLVLRYGSMPLNVLEPILYEKY